MSDYGSLIPAGGGGVLSNFAATVAPTATDDVSKGYSVGSPWMIQGTGDLWRARVVTAGAARWVKSDTSDHPGYVPGRYYMPANTAMAAGGAVLSATTMYLFPGEVKQRLTISQLGARVLVVAAGGNFQLAIYNHDPATGLPSTLVGKTGSGSTATVALVNLPLDANRTIEPGYYWFAIEMDNATVQFAMLGSAAANYSASFGSVNGAIGSANTIQICGQSIPAVFGVWPADISASTFTEITVRIPAIQFLVASVP